jgi:hypothetical protein
MVETAPEQTQQAVQILRGEKGSVIHEIHQQGAAK